MVAPDILSELQRDFVQGKSLKTRSLVVTFFGDIVSQHGGVVWLGSVISALAKFQVNERLVRTTVFRLVQDDWLEAHRQGRRSFYRFSKYGEQEYERAARRIYSMRSGAWSGRWQLVVPIAVDIVNKEKLLRSLAWQGYRGISTGLLAKPGDGGGELLDTLAEFNASDQVLLMTASTSDMSSTELVSDLVYRSWRLDEVADGYMEFLERYSRLRAWLNEPGQRAGITPEVAFMVRLMLIQDYRRLLLQDVPIPDELLPESWPGREAKQTAAEIYRIVAPLSVAYIRAGFQSTEGLFPAAVSGFERRFVD